MIVPNPSPSSVQHLLEGLTAGEDKALFAPDDWAKRLGDDAAARPFVEQLRREWLPIDSVPDSVCQEMMAFGRSYLAGQHPSWPHHWAHTLRVTGMALALAPEAGIDSVHAFLLGIFHDLGKLEELLDDGNEPHEEIGARLIREQLWRTLSDQTITLLANVIAKRSRPGNPYTQLLHDADKLDKIGATGIARRLSTDFGARYPTLALRRVKTDLDAFPEMSFPTSRRFAEIKRAFTESFFTLLPKK